MNFIMSDPDWPITSSNKCHQTVNMLLSIHQLLLNIAYCTWIIDVS